MHVLVSVSNEVHDPAMVTKTSCLNALGSQNLQSFVTIKNSHAEQVAASLISERVLVNYFCHDCVVRCDSWRLEIFICPKQEEIIILFLKRAEAHNHKMHISVENENTGCIKYNVYIYFIVKVIDNNTYRWVSFRRLPGFPKQESSLAILELTHSRETFHL